MKIFDIVEGFLPRSAIRKDWDWYGIAETGKQQDLILLVCDSEHHAMWAVLNNPVILEQFYDAVEEQAHARPAKGEKSIYEVGKWPGDNVLRYLDRHDRLIRGVEVDKRRGGIILDHYHITTGELEHLTKKKNVFTVTADSDYLSIQEPEWTNNQLPDQRELAFDRPHQQISKRSDPRFRSNNNNDSGGGKFRVPSNWRDR